MKLTLLLKIENNILTLHDLGRLIYYFPKTSKWNVNHPKTQIGMITTINQYGVKAIFGNNEMYVNLEKCKFVNTKNLMETNSKKTDNQNKLEINTLFENLVNSPLRVTNNLDESTDYLETLSNLLFYNIPFNQEVNIIKDRLIKLFTESLNPMTNVVVLIDKTPNTDIDDEAEKEL